MSIISPTLEAIEIKLPVDLLKKIRAEARRRGTNPDAVIAEAASEKVARIEQSPHAGMTFREILAPLAEDFEKTGMTDDELGDWIDSEIETHRAEKRSNG